MTRPEWCPQDVWERALSAMGGRWDARWFQTETAHTIARAILAERERCAQAGRSAVMKFKSRVGGRYYPGYHEDMRSAVAEAIRQGATHANT